MELKLAKYMLKECAYREFCPEMFGCGYDKSEQYKNEVTEYHNVFAM